MFEALFGGIAAFVAIVQVGIARRDQRDKALLALYAALSETQVYIAQRRGRARNPEKEARLAQLWLAASVPLGRIDRRLAALCDHKRAYWSNPTKWRGDDRINTAIRLDAMQDRFEDMKRSVLSAFIARPAVVRRTRLKRTK